ncbi:MAG: HAD family hydrolase [Halobacteriota archaeon]|nr:HAD family hydrolase [Halobacteriota archaeon]
MNKEISAIFFDLGDTLLDMSIISRALSFGFKRATSGELVTDEFVLRWGGEWNRVFDHYFKKGEFYTVRRLQLVSLKNVLVEEGINISDRELNDAVVGFWQYFIENCNLHDDVLPTLSRLIQDKYKLGLITNSDEVDVSGILEKHKKHNLDEVFKMNVISSALKRYKPDLLLFQRALELSKCLPREVIYVGDSLTDIYGAKKLDMNTVLIDRKKVEGSLMKVEPDFRIDNLKQIHSIIDEVSIQ